MATNKKDLKIFSYNRIKFEQLYNDAVSYIKRTYSAVNQYFNVSSPFAQLLTVVLHMGRMILYYIEDSITGLNIKTAYRPDQIRGLATLTGHDPARSISARGAIRISYYETGSSEHSGEICYITNKIGLKCTLNACSYVVMFSADNAKIQMKASNYIDASIVQGKLKYQQATGNGEALQSFNFTERNHGEIDQYFVNVYVNGERWDVCDSLLDLGYNQKGCIVKTGMLSGLDVFFGNGSNGAIPGDGSTIMVEYILTDGSITNLPKETLNSDNFWEFQETGFLSDGTKVDLNENFRVKALTDIIFGTSGEHTSLTQLIAPHTSRAMVLANEVNYKYFLKRMNMFSVIEVIRGYKTSYAEYARIQYDKAYNTYSDLSNEYAEKSVLYGENSTEVQEINEKLDVAMRNLEAAADKLDDDELDDNTIYLMLIPSITNRLSSTTNYFSCDESLFLLNDDEKNNIINLIDASGQRVITVENQIIDPKIPRFAINADVRLWDNYTQADIYAIALEKLSDYFLSNTRRDRIPVSDIVALFENIKGIDSVRVSFDADKENSTIYGENNYGIDEYGDVLLSRNVVDINGSSLEVHDIYPLFRGGFTSKDGIEYSSEQDMTNISGFNLRISGYSHNTRISLENSTLIG